MNIQFHIPLSHGMPVSQIIITYKRVFHGKEKKNDLTCLYFHNKHGNLLEICHTDSQ